MTVEVHPLQMFTSAEVGKLLRLSQDKIADLARRGEIEGIQVTGKNYWRFSYSAIQSFQHRSRQEALAARV